MYKNNEKFIVNNEIYETFISVLFKPTDPCNEEIAHKLCGKATVCRPHSNKNFHCTCKAGFYSIGSFKPFKREETFIEKCEGKYYFMFLIIEIIFGKVKHVMHDFNNF